MMYALPVSPRLAFSLLFRLSALAALAACGVDHAVVEPAVEITFVADPGPPGSEAYLCFGGDAAPLEGMPVARVTYAQTEGAVALHHLQLFAILGDYPDGPVPCEGVPENSVELDVIALAGGDTWLPAGVGLALPAGARRLVAQAHVLRLKEGPAQAVTLRVQSARSGFAHLAGYLRMGAPVPALRPHTDESARRTCRMGRALHAIASWPHMHRAGVEFHASILRAGGAREALVDVVPWNFDDQRIYAVDAELTAGDAIESRCLWRNDGDQYILPGPKTANEMCSHALIAWPFEAVDSVTCD